MKYLELKKWIKENFVYCRECYSGASETHFIDTQTKTRICFILFLEEVQGYFFSHDFLNQAIVCNLSSGKYHITKLEHIKSFYVEFNYLCDRINYY